MQDNPTLPPAHSPSSPREKPSTLEAWGPFRLFEHLGSGSFGEVYRAWDTTLDREVALKLLLPSAVGDDEEYAAMLREARTIAKIQHHNIVRVYGIDRHDGRVGFWTDFISGKTLTMLVKDQGPMGYQEAVHFGIEISRALSAVHRAGLLHRDIKADNVMREDGGRILLMDFGLSVGKRSLDAGLAGTPNYMAPELSKGGTFTVAADIYAMGVLLYFLVTGETPARLLGRSPEEVEAALAKRALLMDQRPDLPDAFLETVRVATNLDPAKRFATAGELAESLQSALSSQDSPPPSPSQLTEELPVAKRARWALPAVFALISTLLFIVGILGLLGWRAYHRIRLTIASDYRSVGWVSAGGAAGAGEGVTLRVWLGDENLPLRQTELKYAVERQHGPTLVGNLSASFAPGATGQQGIQLTLPTDAKEVKTSLAVPDRSNNRQFCVRQKFNVETVGGRTQLEEKDAPVVDQLTSRTRCD